MNKQHNVSESSHIEYTWYDHISIKSKNREKPRGFCDREVLNQRKWTQFSIYLSVEVIGRHISRK